MTISNAMNQVKVLQTTAYDKKYGKWKAYIKYSLFTPGMSHYEAKIIGYGQTAKEAKKALLERLNNLQNHLTQTELSLKKEELTKV